MPSKLSLRWSTTVSTPSISIEKSLKLRSIYGLALGGMKGEEQVMLESNSYT
jgi:hypothetical protein